MKIIYLGIQIANHFTVVSIIDNIKELREKNNFSQDYVASKLSMTQQAYQKIENGTTNLKLEIILSLAKLYKVGSHELIGNADTELQKIFDKKEKEIELLKNEIDKLNFIITELNNQINKRYISKSENKL